MLRKRLRTRALDWSTCQGSRIMGRRPSVGDRRAASPNRCVSTPCTPTPEVTMYYLGIDLHKDESHVAVLDDDAEVVEEIRVLMSTKSFVS